MKVFFINRTSTNINGNIEGVYFYYLYLLAEKAELNSLLPFTIGMWLESNNWSAKLIIEMFYLYCPPESMATPKEKILSFLKSANEMKQHKQKSKEEIIFLNRFKGFIDRFKKYVIEYHEWMLKTVNVWNWIDLLKEDVLQLSWNEEYNLKDMSEDEMISLIYTHIIQKEEFFLLDGILGKYMNEIPLDNYKKGTWSFKKPEIYSFPLFSIPYGKNLSKENMSILHRELQNKISPISTKLNEFRSSLFDEDFGDAVKEKTMSFFETLIPETELFQKHIDSQMYFRQVINSDKDCFNAQIRVGVCSIKTMAHYFGKSKILLPFVADALKKKLAMHTDINKSEAFLYIKLPEHILKTNIPSY